VIRAIRNSIFRGVDCLSRKQKQGLLFAIDLVLGPIALGVMAFALTGGVLWAAPWMLVTLLLTAAASVALDSASIRLKSYEAPQILRTGGMVLVVMTCLSLLLTAVRPETPPSAPLLFGGVFFILAVSMRVLLLYALLWVLAAGQARQNVLIYGAGDTGMQIAAALRAHDRLVPVAFVDDDPALAGQRVAGLRVFPPQAIAGLARDHEVSRVVLAMPGAAQRRLADLTHRLGGLGLTAMAVPSFAQLLGVDEIAGALTPVSPGDFLNRAPLETPVPSEVSSYCGRVIMVTGAGGTVGAALCRQLLRSRPACLVLFDMSEIALYHAERELSALATGTQTRIVAALGSVTDARITRQLMQEHEVDTVFHAAAYKHVPLVEANPLAGLANNVLGTRIIADAAIHAGVKSFVLISSDKAVRPTNVMGASKRLAELVVQDLAKRHPKTAFSMVRFGNVLGSSGSVVPLFREQIAKGGPVTLTHEDVSRYFMTIEEAATLLVLAGSFAEQRTGGQSDVFVLDMGEPVRIRALAEQMIAAAGLSLRSAQNPQGDIDIQVIGLRPGEKLQEELLIGAGLLTTPHPKILRAHEQSLSELEVATALRDLRNAVASGSVQAALQLIARFVEGYTPPITRPIVPQKHNS
jgi:FlaA1/EpsC-like NDP-sugar epimerase